MIGKPELFRMEHSGYFRKGVKCMTRKELADKCRAWRLAMGITQAEIADKAGTSSQAVSQFENGLCNSLRIYCAYLDYGYKSDWTQGAAMMGGAENG